MGGACDLYEKAGLPVEALIEYVKLYQEGDETFEARLQLLSEEREKLEEQKAQIESAINRLNHKISKYEEAVKTGVLNWEENSSMYIEKINGPEDVKKLTVDEMTVMAGEMRESLLKRASIHGGHFGPNFGMVEATIALHYVFESPKDKIVYDVSHQTYPHKMLTGRKDAYLYEEHYDDVSGYSNPNESVHDHFTVGHTSTSVSLACGLAKARDLKGEDGNVIAVIGDGSLSGGEALEGLDYAVELDGNLIIVVNDNDMSIAENHGGLYGNLKLLRETNGQAECNLFKAMGLDYIYVDHGNAVGDLIEAFQSVKDSRKPVVVHINTLKGKGYAPAEQNKEVWHYNGPFHIETGEPLYEMTEEDYSDISLNYLLDKMKKKILQ